jgi:hypothetical protein
MPGLRQYLDHCSKFYKAPVKFKVKNDAVHGNVSAGASSGILPNQK